ncbi:MAG: hypothetical protein ACRDAM_10420 [Casimicrobium sp.]
MNRFFLRSAALFFLAATTLSAHATERFRVAFEIAINGETVQAPSIVTVEKSPAKLTLSSPSGDGYELGVVVESMPGEQIKIALEFASEKYGNASPTLVMRYGQPTTFETSKGPDQKLSVKLTATRETR